MGSFYMKCGITNTTITDGSEMYSFILIENKYRKINEGNTYVYDDYQILPVTIKGTYDDYGNIASDESQKEYLDKQMEAFDKDFIIYYEDEEYNLAEICDKLGSCYGSKNHPFHEFVNIVGTFGGEEIEIMGRNDTLFKEKYRVASLMVNGRFVDKLLANYRENPYREFLDDEMKEKIRRYCGVLSQLDQYTKKLYVDNNVEGKIYLFIMKYMQDTNTAKMPSNYGGQEVDLASLRIMSEFCEEEIKHLYDNYYYEGGEYDSAKEVIEEHLGGTHWKEVDGKYTYTDY